MGYKKEFEKEFEKALEKAGALEFLAKSLWSLIKKLHEDGNGTESDKTVIEIGGKVAGVVQVHGLEETAKPTAAPVVAEPAEEVTTAPMEIPTEVELTVKIC